MKLLCIKQPNNNTTTRLIPSIIEVGEEYNSVGEYPDEDGDMFYELLEHPGFLYMSVLFVPAEDNYAEDVLENCICTKLLKEQIHIYM
jgi:hypothetical protein